MFGGVKDGCGRVESNLQTTLDLAALRCSCLHAGGTAACSVAPLERGQEQNPLSSRNTFAKLMSGTHLTCHH